MNIESILESEWCARVVLTLASFLWQGVLLGVLAALAMIVLRRRSARVRYGVMVGMLALMAVCPVLTYVAVSHVPKPVALVLPTSAPEMPDSASTPEPNSAVETANTAVEAMPPIAPVDVSEMPTATALAQARGKERPWASTEQVLVVAYALGVVSMLLRLGLGVLGGKRLRRRSRPVEESVLLTTLAHSAQALGMRVAPALAYCQHVAVPTVVGIVRPMILLPMSFASGLTPQQIEFLLLHELAHIRRFDHLVNIAQRLVEAFLFFHPAVWYVSRRIRYERELCCDDLVVKQGGEARAYAESLIAAATLACQGRLAPASLAALSATDNPSQLRRRVQRLLGSNEPRVRLVHGGWTISAMMLLVAVIAVAQVSTPSTQPEPEQTQTAQAESASVEEPAQASPVQEAGSAVQAETEEQPEETLPQSAAPQSPPAAPRNIVSGPFVLAAWADVELVQQLKDPDWWLRKLAIQQIVETKEPRYVTWIILALADEDDRVKAAAAEALGQVGDPKTIKHLIAALKNNTPVCEAAAEALTKFPQDKVMPILRIAASDEDETVYSGAVAALERIDNPETLQLLVSLLPRVPLTDGEGDPLTAQLRAAFGKKDTTQALAALTEAGRSADKAMRGGVAKVLCPNLEGNPRGAIAEQPAENLCKAQETVALLKALSTDTDRNVRAVAVLALGGILSYRQQFSKQPTEDVCAALASSLRDTNRAIASMAATSLYSVNWQPATPEDRAYYLTAQGKPAEAAALGNVAFEALSRALTSDNEPAFQPPRNRRQPTRVVRQNPNEVAASTVAALGQLNDARNIPVLIEALRSNDPNIAWNAASALGTLKEKSAIDALAEMAQHSSSDHRHSAITALRDIGDARAVPAVVAALKDPERSVRNRAAETLGVLGDARAVPELLRVLEGDNVFAIRSAAAESLGKLKDPSAIAPLAEAFETASKVPDTPGAPDLQGSAIAAIGEIGGSQACDALLPLLTRYPDGFFIITALVKTGDQRAAGPIATAVVARADEDNAGADAITDVGLDALVKLATPQALTGIHDFVSVAESRNPGYALKGVEALAKVPKPEASDLLFELADRVMNESVQVAEGCALAERGDERARSILDRYKENPEYRSKVTEALQKLDAAKAAGKTGEAAAAPAAPETPAVQ
ncbi:MAG: HEAT repeat domain-containing protein [Candidatus Hydrogenedentales bacterium]|jgi:HEAT repeat protein/beta-lactamase regulating signal transducer with metallopeptidase domain